MPDLHNQNSPFILHLGSIFSYVGSMRRKGLQIPVKMPVGCLSILYLTARRKEKESVLNNPYKKALIRPQYIPEPVMSGHAPTEHAERGNEFMTFLEDKH